MKMKTTDGKKMNLDQEDFFENLPGELIEGLTYRFKINTGGKAPIVKRIGDTKIAIRLDLPDSTADLMIDVSTWQRDVQVKLKEDERSISRSSRLGIFCTTHTTCEIANILLECVSSFRYELLDTVTRKLNTLKSKV